MTPQEIIEENKLIAKFMGRKGKVNAHLYWVNVPSVKWVTIEQMQFHTSWDWLMCVVEKIESLGFYFNIKKNHVVVACDNKDTRDSEMIHSEWGDQSKIERVFQCAVAFVKYCNQNKSV